MNQGPHRAIGQSLSTTTYVYAPYVLQCFEVAMYFNIEYAISNQLRDNWTIGNEPNSKVNRVRVLHVGECRISSCLLSVLPLRPPCLFQ